MNVRRKTVTVLVDSGKDIEASCAEAWKDYSGDSNVYLGIFAAWSACADMSLTCPRWETHKGRVYQWTRGSGMDANTLIF